MKGSECFAFEFFVSAGAGRGARGGGATRGAWWGRCAARRVVGVDWEALVRYWTGARRIER